MRGARVAINGELGVGDVKGLVQESNCKTTLPCLEILKKATGDSGVFCWGGGVSRIGIPGGFEVEKPWRRSSTLSRGLGEQPPGSCPAGVVERMRSSCGGDY